MIRSRCAIYTRKSTEEGLDQSFNSLDAQREACSAYILSQRHEGWSELADRYDDGGFSGGSMERPGLARLLEDVRAGRIDVIVVYKVDRLTRSLPDFAKMVEVFDAAKVSFVSVTQAFNTTTSMGRLTLNVLLSFAQFEREVTAERIRDKVAASKQKGMWMGGAVPMGYDARDKALVINVEEAAAVRTIFTEYLRLESVPALIRRLDELGIVSKTRTDRFGRVTGGTAYSRGALYHLLRNPVYAGRTRHGEKTYDGLHEAIIDTDTWQRVQVRLDANGGGQIVGQRKTAQRWLDGVLFDAHGRAMKSDYAMKPVGESGARKRYHYYVSRKVDGWDHPPARLPAGQIEEAVLSEIQSCLIKPDRLLEGDAAVQGEPALLIGHARKVASRLSTAEENDREDLMKSLVQRVDLGRGNVKITINLGDLKDDVQETLPLAVTFASPFATQQNGRARPIVVRTGGSDPKRDPELIALVADARRWTAELLSGESATAEEITRREKLRSGSVSRILPLAWLAPDITSAILDGRHPPRLTAKRLRELKELPLDWNGQRKLLGFPPA